MFLAKSNSGSSMSMDCIRQNTRTRRMINIGHLSNGKIC